MKSTVVSENKISFWTEYTDIVLQVDGFYINTFGLLLLHFFS